MDLGDNASWAFLSSTVGLHVWADQICFGYVGSCVRALWYLVSRVTLLAIQCLPGGFGWIVAICIWCAPCVRFHWWPTQIQCTLAFSKDERMSQTIAPSTISCALGRCGLSCCMEKHLRTWWLQSELESMEQHKDFSWYLVRSHDLRERCVNVPAFG